MKITQLTIKNFLKLKDIQIAPDQKVNVIVGKNGQGKSAILKAIQTAFDGKITDKMIRKDESKAEIIIELEDYKIERKITEKDSYLNIENKEGWKMPAPQKFLNGIIGQFSFNPIEFFQLKAIDKKKYLLEMINIKLDSEKLGQLTGPEGDLIVEILPTIDFEKHGLEVIENLYKGFYQQRTFVNKEMKQKEEAYNELFKQIPEGFDATKFDPERISTIRASITANALKKAKKESLTQQLMDKAALISKLQAELVEAQQQQEAIKKEMDSILYEDTEKLQIELDELDKMKELIQTNNQLTTLQTDLTKIRERQGKIDNLVNKLGKEIPDILIKEAKLPVEGLGMEGEMITLNGVNIENLSTSEQLKFALSISQALNQQFGIVCIDRLESLDKETFEWFIQEIEKDQFQYFITKVDGEKGWLIEDGEISKNITQ